MNRQTVAVTIGTLALLVFGGLLLYGTPGAEVAPTPAADVAHEAGEPGAKAKGKGKAKAEKAKADGKRLGDAKLVHATDLPADRATPPAGAPNVVLVIESTQRRDQWTPYGGPATTTPYLASRAAEGVLMTDALAVAVDPRPSDAAIVTGRWPHALGVVTTSPDKKNGNWPLADSADTLAERLATAGWHTVGLSANHHLNVKAGGGQGFDWYRDSQPFSLMLDQRITSAELVSKALERVTARTEVERGHPLFLQLAFVDSHKPIKLPPEEASAFQGENAEVAPYRATLKRQDDAIKALVDGLAAQGLTAENTVFVVIADHGEGLDLPVHHRKQHGFVLYESAVSIPWLMWGKGIPKGGRVDGLASQIDLAPTLLTLVGVTGQTGFDGMDLSSAVLGKGPTTRTRAYADTLYEGMHRASIWTADKQCQKDYGSKEIEDDTFVDACYDRKADPTFTAPITDAALAAELEKMHGEAIARIPAGGTEG